MSTYTDIPSDGGLDPRNAPATDQQVQPSVSAPRLPMVGSRAGLATLIAVAAGLAASGGGTLPRRVESAPLRQSRAEADALLAAAEAKRARRAARNLRHREARNES